ncbi:MAG: HPr family phosphocarrier protein [Deltaproteobacteria bacterium]|nr:HPr family phosphocarrier protein [Deltaproteobacteria bacterium]
MTVASVTRGVEIVNRLGLHARAAATLVELTNKFEAEITIAKDDLEVNAKSIMGILMLAAAKGSTIRVRADGPDAEAAVAEIAALIANRFGEPD